jgi:hypothetical protein
MTWSKHLTWKRSSKLSRSSRHNRTATSHTSQDQHSIGCDPPTPDPPRPRPIIFPHQEQTKNSGDKLDQRSSRIAHASGVNSNGNRTRARALARTNLFVPQFLAEFPCFENSRNVEMTPSGQFARGAYDEGFLPATVNWMLSANSLWIIP